MKLRHNRQLKCLKMSVLVWLKDPLKIFTLAWRTITVLISWRMAPLQCNSRHPTSTHNSPRSLWSSDFIVRVRYPASYPSYCLRAVIRRLRRRSLCAQTRIWHEERPDWGYFWHICINIKNKLFLYMFCDKIPNYRCGRMIQAIQTSFKWKKFSRTSF